MDAIMHEVAKIVCYTSIGLSIIIGCLSFTTKEKDQKKQVWIICLVMIGIAVISGLFVLVLGKQLPT